MTEQHECEWEWTIRDNDAWFFCKDENCHAKLSGPTIATRLNEYEKLKRATDALTAEDATSAEMAIRITFNYLDEASKPIIENRVLPAIRAYADALAG